MLNYSSRIAFYFFWLGGVGGRVKNKYDAHEVERGLRTCCSDRPSNRIEWMRFRVLPEFRVAGLPLVHSMEWIREGGSLTWDVRQYAYVKRYDTWTCECDAYSRKLLKKMRGVMLFGYVKIDAFDVLSTFFFSYQFFKLKLPTFLTKLLTSCNITLQDILHATDW